jgi:hypothetical protein
MIRAKRKQEAQQDFNWQLRSTVGESAAPWQAAGDGCSAHWRLTTVQRDFFPIYPQLLFRGYSQCYDHLYCHAFENAVS